MLNPNTYPCNQHAVLLYTKLKHTVCLLCVVNSVDIKVRIISSYFWSASTVTESLSVEGKLWLNKRIDVCVCICVTVPGSVPVLLCMFTTYVYVHVSISSVYTFHLYHSFVGLCMCACIRRSLYMYKHGHTV